VVGNLPYQVIRYLYDVFAKSAINFRSEASVYEVGEWAGYMNFKLDEHWHLGIATATRTEWGCATAHFQKAANKCPDGPSKGRILIFWAASISGALGPGIAPPARPLITHSDWQHFDQLLRCAKDIREVVRDYTSSSHFSLDLSFIYFRRFLFYGSLDDINTAITIQEGRGCNVLLGFYRQARWIRTRSDDDFSMSAQLVESFLSEWASTWKVVGREMTKGFYYLFVELYAQNSTAVETYIGELERRGYSSTLTPFLRQLQVLSILYESLES
jgi:hypothetical protein